MKKLIFIFIFLSAGLMEAREKPKASFAYDVDFEMRFDNREIPGNFFTPSMTIFGARLTPQVGLALNESNGASHRLMAGIDVMKDFGASPISELIAGGETGETALVQNNIGLFREICLYYNFRKKIEKTDMEIYAGIFPRRAMAV